MKTRANQISEHRRAKSSITNGLIERAMEMRCLSYIASAKHQLLMQTILEVDQSKKNLKQVHQETIESDRMKSLFIATMSHEVRTPLNTIVGFTDLLMRNNSGGLSREQLNHLTTVQGSAKYLMSLISFLLDITHIDSGKIDIKIEKISLRKLVDDLVISVMPDIERKYLMHKIDIPEELTINSDKTRLSQCILNILSNSIKFTDTGGVSVQARKQDTNVYISIRDTGMGISAEAITKIFEPFESYPAGNNNSTKGTGLGLYLTRKIVTEVLHGSIKVDSTVGEGSTFTITLPEDASMFI